jgi:hypothetical protein
MKKKARLFDALLAGASDKVSREASQNAKRSGYTAVGALAAGYALKDTPYDSLAKNAEQFVHFLHEQPIMHPIKQYLPVDGASPLEHLTQLSMMGFDPNTISTLLFTVAAVGIYRAVNADAESALQDKLARFGATLCPYESYALGCNDTKGKAIQLKLNAGRNIANEFSEKSIAYRAISGVLNGVERSIKTVSPAVRKFLGFFGKGHHGFETMSYRISSYENQVLVADLPVAKEIKNMIRPTTFDIDNNRQYDERRFVTDVRKKATSRAKDEVTQRNVNLAFVKLILEYKDNDGIMEDKSHELMKDILSLNALVSEESRPRYVELCKLAKTLFEKKEDKPAYIDVWHFSGYKKGQTEGENTFRILMSLDKLCYANKIAFLKKPMTYRELYRNELIFAIQERLRDKHSDLALLNRASQDMAPPIFRHFTYDKNKADVPLYEILNKKNFRVLKNNLHVNPESFEGHLTDKERLHLAEKMMGTYGLKRFNDRKEFLDTLSVMLRNVGKKEADKIEEVLPFNLSDYLYNMIEKTQLSQSNEVSNTLSGAVKKKKQSK